MHKTEFVSSKMLIIVYHAMHCHFKRALKRIISDLKKKIGTHDKTVNAKLARPYTVFSLTTQSAAFDKSLKISSIYYPKYTVGDIENDVHISYNHK